MDIKKTLGVLRFPELTECWDAIEAMADEPKLSKSKLLAQMVELLIQTKDKNLLKSRIKRASLPKHYSINTYPFAKQKVKIEEHARQLHDSISYMKKGKNIILIGPTGTGKTGLSTCFLTQALKNGYTGRFISFSELISQLARNTQLLRDRRFINQMKTYDCLVIDEVGYIDIDKQYIGHFFEIISGREDKCTIITSNLGFDEWQGFLKNAQITAAILDRITTNAEYFDLMKGNSIRGVK